VVASEALENAVAVLKKIQQVAKNDDSAKLNECLSRTFGGGSCHSMRFIGDIFKARNA
jgi:hypothetical protein